MLNDKQKRFVAEYLVDQNATQAAIRAGYSAKTAEQQGSRLLRNAEVAAAVAKGQRRVADKLEITADRVLAEMAAMAFFDPSDIASQRMKGPEDIVALPETVRRAIVGWSWDRQGNFVLKLANKQGALDQLAKHLGLFREPGDSPDNPVHVADVSDEKRLAAVALMAARAVKADAK